MSVFLLRNPNRFTPTPVGNAVGEPVSADAGGVHPHACGECAMGELSIATCCGSPPRLWGMPEGRGESGRAHRFTPTPVGNAYLRPSQRRRQPVHPHACGECKLASIIRSIVLGSPPRLWGMPTRVRRHVRPHRFTPTPVGNADWGNAHPVSKSVHPHACGECRRPIIADVHRHGSPPRLWGMREGGGRGCVLRRFTPTPVGNALAAQAAIYEQTVHPHACGECVLLIPINAAWLGSPPRLWGMLAASVILRRRRRFTPTPVGNASGRRATQRDRSVHPHACGECSELPVMR